MYEYKYILYIYTYYPVVCNVSPVHESIDLCGCFPTKYPDSAKSH